MKHTEKDALINQCEDYLLQRYIPLHSYTGDNIIKQAIKEGYMIELFDKYYAKSAWVSVHCPYTGAFLMLYYIHTN